MVRHHRSPKTNTREREREREREIPHLLLVQVGKILHGVASHVLAERLSVHEVIDQAEL